MKDLTKREYFAAQALAGGASPSLAVNLADVLIKELEEKKPNK